MSPLQAERRPAIWPWLVMPLITLALFYCLDRLRQGAEEQDDLGAVQSVHSPAEPTSP